MVIPAPKYVPKVTEREYPKEKVLLGGVAVILLTSKAYDMKAPPLVFEAVKSASGEVKALLTIPLIEPIEPETAALTLAPYSLYTDKVLKLPVTLLAV